MSELGTTIRSMRKERNLTVRELAERSGVSHSFLSQVETGKNNASPTIIRKLASGLNCEYTELGLEMDNQDRLIEELVSLNLWSARRLPKVHKEFAYGLLDELINKKHERV